MRICLVARDIHTFATGGIATYVAEMGNALVASGHETHILTYPYPGLLERGPAMIRGARFHVVDPAAGAAGIYGAYQSEAGQYSMAVYEALKKLQREHRFEYVEFPEYRGEGHFSLRAKRSIGEFADAVLGVRLHTPLYFCRVLDRQDIYTVELAHIEAMEKASVRDADLVLSASRAMLDRLVEDLGARPPEADGLEQSRAVLPLPLDVSAMEGEFGPEEGEGPAEGTREVLYFGRMQLIKGVIELVEAGTMLLEAGRDLRFRFVGGDTETGPFGRSMRSHLEKLAARSGRRERFIFEDHRARGEVGALVRRAAVCCFPSRWESFSLACIEAMAMGAVVVGAGAGGIGEIIEDGRSGLLFPAGDSAALAAALSRALDDRELRRTVRLNGPRRARELGTPERVVRSLRQLVERALERNRVLEGAMRSAGKGDNGQRARGGVPGVISGRRPRVSIVVPYYNCGDYLPATLASVQRQTYRDAEVIIVDDGSTEAGSLRLLEELRSRPAPAGDVRMRFVRKPNGGLGSARNAGFRAARAEWVFTLDADDLIREDALELLVRAMERERGVAYASTLFRSFTEHPENVVSGHVALGLERDLLLYQNIGGVAGGSLFRREVVMGLGGYDEWLTSFEDWDLWLRLAAAGHRGSIVPEFLVYYRIRPGSLIRTEVADRSHMLKAYLLAKHPSVTSSPDKPIRLYLAEAERLRGELAAWQGHAGRVEAEVERLRAALAAGGGTGSARSEADRLIAENIRYRMADRVNRAFKAVGIHRPVKDALVKVRRLSGASRSK